MSQDDTPSFALLAPEDSDAAEILFREVQRAGAAFKAFAERVKGEGELQRLQAGVWAVVSTPTVGEGASG